MNRLLVVCAFAGCMIFAALATAIGTIPADAGETALIAMPALAIATLGNGKCCNQLEVFRT